MTGPGAAAPVARTTQRVDPRLRRILLWLLVVAFVVAGAAVGVDLLQRLDVLPGTGIVPRILAAGSMALGGVVAVWATLERRTRAVPRRRLALLLLATGLAVVFGGQSLGYVATASWPGAFPVWVEAAPVAVGLPLVAASVVWLTWPPATTRRDVVLIAADGAVAATSLALVWWMLILPAWQPGDSGLEDAFVAIDPWVQYVAVLGVILAAAASRRSGSLPFRQLVALQAAVLVYVTSDVAGDVIAEADRRSVITWSILGYLVAVGLLVSFTFRRALEADSPVAAFRRDLWSLVVPFIPVVIAAIGVVVLRVRGQLISVVALGWLVLAVVVALLSTLVARLLAVLVIDLRGFRGVNDGHGHEVGDEVLRRVAAALDRLPDSVRAVARVGGDEFAAAVADERVEAEVADIERELRAGLADLLLPGGSRLTQAFDLGYSVYDRPGIGAAELLEDADLALGAAGQAAAVGTLRYEPQMRSTLVRRLRAEADLREALDEGRLAVHYQPIVALSSGRTVGLEALVRLRNSAGGLVPPADFLPSAEDLGLMPRIGREVLRTALSDLKAVRAATRRPLSVSVNVSARELDETFVAGIADALAAAEVEPQSLVLELTETSVVENRDLATVLLAELRELGCRVALDDFGTGYSSLSYVATLPLDFLKIDASFIRDLGTSRTSQALVRTVVQLGLNLGLHTVAEGLETMEQVDLVRGMGCDRGQGFVFARPVPLDALVEFLQGMPGVVSVDPVRPPIG
ncbi:MAG: bifunctional diguanylate cyclase/phosphodiesterase [Candidatus Nanopelagicales bacterium]